MGYVQSELSEELVELRKLTHSAKINRTEESKEGR